VAHGSAVLRDGVTRPSASAARSATSATGPVKSASGVLDTLFGALADPTRRMLVERLLTKGPATATTLAETTPLTRQAVLKHLQVLEAAGLLAHERSGREVRYRVTPQPLASAVGWILDTAGQWDSRIDRLRRLDT
jgi:DNA-binding transcriptional ArsR family regulator